MSMTSEKSFFNELFDQVMEEASPDYVEDSYEGVIEESPEAGAVAQTGDIGNQIMTGTCLQTSEASEGVKNGINPINGEELENYEDVQEYLKQMPDSLGTFSNQFGITDMEDGTLYMIKEDAEWPEKFCSQLDEAGIDYNEGKVENDVNEAYNQVLDSFKSYVSEVLDNDIDFEMIKTSEMKEGMNSYIDDFKEEHEITEDQGIYEHICLLTSPFGMELVEEELGLEPGTLDMIDPKSHHPYLFDLDSEKSNIFAEAAVNYYQETENPENNVALTYPVLSPYGKGVDKEPIEGEPVNAENLEEVIEDIKDVDVSAPINSELMKISTAFPNQKQQIIEVLEIQNYIDQRKDQWKKEAQSEVVEEEGVNEIGELFQDPEKFGFENHKQIGNKIGAKANQIKEQKTGIIKAKELLADEIAEDLQTIFQEAGDEDYEEA